MHVLEGISLVLSSLLDASIVYLLVCNTILPLALLDDAENLRTRECISALTHDFQFEHFYTPVQRGPVTLTYHETHQAHIALNFKSNSTFNFLNALRTSKRPPSLSNSVARNCSVNFSMSACCSRCS